MLQERFHCSFAFFLSKNRSLAAACSYDGHALAVLLMAVQLKFFLDLKCWLLAFSQRIQRFSLVEWSFHLDACLP